MSCGAFASAEPTPGGHRRRYYIGTTTSGEARNEPRGRGGGPSRVPNLLGPGGGRRQSPGRSIIGHGPIIKATRVTWNSPAVE